MIQNFLNSKDMVSNLGENDLTRGFKELRLIIKSSSLTICETWIYDLCPNRQRLSFLGNDYEK